MIAMISRIVFYCPEVGSCVVGVPGAAFVFGPPNGLVGEEAAGAAEEPLAGALGVAPPVEAEINES